MAQAKGQAEEIQWYSGSAGSRTPTGQFVTLSPSGGISISPDLTGAIDPKENGACRVGRLNNPDRLVLVPCSRQTPDALCWAQMRLAGKTMRLAGAGVLRQFGLLPSGKMRCDASWQGDRIIVVLATQKAQSERRPRAQKAAPAKATAKATAAEAECLHKDMVCPKCMQPVPARRVADTWLLDAHNHPDGGGCKGRMVSAPNAVPRSPVDHRGGGRFA